jgi:hypothetical protein
MHFFHNLRILPLTIHPRLRSLFVPLELQSVLSLLFYHLIVELALLAVRGVTGICVVGGDVHLLVAQTAGLALLLLLFVPPRVVLELLYIERCALLGRLKSSCPVLKLGEEHVLHKSFLNRLVHRLAMRV